MELGTREYGGIAALAGAMGLYVALEMNWPNVAMVSSMILIVGALAVYLALAPWYCSMCGQNLGRVVKPRECGRCGSNRMTKRDPGVGDAVRVKR